MSADGRKWYDVARVGDLGPNEIMYVEVGSDPVVLCNLDGEFFALSDICTHQDASLSDGEIIGDELECPLHGGAFEIRTGMPASFPVVVPAETYDVRVDGEIIYAAKKP
ncbi:MAG: non-heme iron oxygenase ferredoxin subunit [Thermomicrobiales bacterium]|nr:non-heme iron oxygenase ferredoxin subunit [Thermomicrobiales bacterium]